MVQCVIFDCDGTLVDSEFLCNLGLEIKLREYGIEACAKEMMKKFRGAKLATILQKLEKEHQIELENNFISSYRLLVDKLFEERLKPCEGVPEMLAALSLPKCVASSGPLGKINKALTVTGLIGFFINKIFSSYEVGSWKPDPGIFLHAANYMGFSPDQCVVVDDSLIGITAAKSAGMLPLLYDPEGVYSHIKDVCTIQHMSQLHNAII